MEELIALCGVSILLNIVLCWLWVSALKRNRELIGDCAYFMDRILELRKQIEELKNK